MLQVQSLPGWQHSILEVGHEIFSMVIFSLPLIQEGNCQSLAKECAQVLVNCLEDLACPGKSVVR